MKAATVNNANALMTFLPIQRLTRAIPMIRSQAQSCQFMPRPSHWMVLTESLSSAFYHRDSGPKCKPWRSSATRNSSRRPFFWTKYGASSRQWHQGRLMRAERSTRRHIALVKIRLLGLGKFLSPKAPAHILWLKCAANLSLIPPRKAALLPTTVRIQVIFGHRSRPCWVVSSTSRGHHVT